MSGPPHARIFAWGREGLALTALHSEAMNQKAREVRLDCECSRVINWLAEADFYGPWESSAFGSNRLTSIGHARRCLKVAVTAYLRGKGGIETLLLAYDSTMADAMACYLDRLEQTNDAGVEQARMPGEVFRTSNSSTTGETGQSAT